MTITGVELSPSGPVTITSSDYYCLILLLPPVHGSSPGVPAGEGRGGHDIFLGGKEKVIRKNTYDDRRGW